MEKDLDTKNEVETLDAAQEEQVEVADDSLSVELDFALADDAEELSEQDVEATNELDEFSLESREETLGEDSVQSDDEELEDSELASFESAEIEDEEFVEDDRVMSIVESILFATEKPQTVNTIKQAFQGTNIKSKHIKRALESLMVDYASAQRGFTLEEVGGGYQMRTKVDNMEFLKRMLKPKSFRLSGPALEVLSITAYKQPCIKMHIDEIRGVESGHLLRALMEKGLVSFAGKSEFPGKPMLYQTTRKFLEVFGLRNINELPSLSEIDELIPEGIGEEEEEKPQLNQITDELSNDAIQSYSEHEDELDKITDKLSQISTSSDFFEQEKLRQKQKRDAEKAQDIQDKLAMDEDVEKKDIKWLERYEKVQEELALQKQQEQEAVVASSEQETQAIDTAESVDQLSSENQEAQVNPHEQSEEQSLSESDVASSDEPLSLSDTEDDPVAALEKAIETQILSEASEAIQNIVNEEPEQHQQALDNTEKDPDKDL